MDTTTIGYNGKVICTPFERMGVQAVENKGFATARHKTVLVGLKVIFGNGKDVYPGDTIFVNGDGQKTWGEKAVEIDGEQVCICPPEQIVAVKHVLSATNDAPKYQDRT